MIRNPRDNHTDEGGLSICECHPINEPTGCPEYDAQMAAQVEFLKQEYQKARDLETIERKLSMGLQLTTKECMIVGIIQI